MATSRLHGGSSIMVLPRTCEHLPMMAALQLTWHAGMATSRLYSGSLSIWVLPRTWLVASNNGRSPIIKVRHALRGSSRLHDYTMASVERNCK